MCALILECFPTKGYFKNNAKLIVKRTKVGKSTKPDKSGLIRFHLPLAVAAIALIVYVLQHPELVPHLSGLEEKFIQAGYYVRKEVMLEAVINGLGWSIMHLFIRRALNPENSGTWFDGYFLDSCYGGMAAFGQTLFKGFFLYTLLRKGAGQS
jgi:hypothetical protein